MTTVSMQAQGLVTFETKRSEEEPLRDIHFGLEIADDGRVWICIDGVTWIRFKPNKES